MTKESAIYGKVPPQNIEMEQAVIGACLLERDTFEQVMEILYSPECFYKESHQLIYGAMCELYNSGNNVDLLTVTEQLIKNEKLEKAGGAYEITQLTMSVLTSAHVIDHARIIMEKYMKRECIRIGLSMANDAFSDGTDPFELIEQAEHSLKSISDGLISDELTQVGQTYMEVCFDLETQRNEKTDLTGVDTGYPDLNQLTNGWQKSELILLAARPSQGKTALSLNFALNAKVPTLIFSLEASKKALVKRLAACKTGVPFKQIRQGSINDFQMELINKYVSEFNRMPIKIDDKTQSLNGIIKSIRREHKRNENLGLVIIDYLQLVKGSREKNGNREQEVSNISRSLKLLASELEVPIIALCQLNRQVETTANKRPNLSNLRESGSLEQDANIAMFIWWEESGNNPDNTKQYKTWLLVEKNRDGECKPVELKFNGDIQKWLDANDFDTAPVPSFMQRPSGNGFNRSDWDF